MVKSKQQGGKIPDYSARTAQIKAHYSEDKFPFKGIHFTSSCLMGLVFARCSSSFLDLEYINKI